MIMPYLHISEIREKQCILGEQGISNASHYYKVICGQCDLAHKGFVLYVENKEQADNAKEQHIESNPDHVIRVFEFTMQELI